MIFHPAFFFIPPLAAFGLAAVVVFREGKSLAHRLFIAGLCLLGLESSLVGFSLLSPTIPEAVSFQRAALIVGGFLPVVWTAFTLTYSRGNYSSFLRKWMPVLILFGAAPLVCLFFWGQLIVQAGRLDSGDIAFGLGLPALTLKVILLIGAVATLMNLERTFKASVGTMRWQIKFMLLGTGIIFAARIYTSSQAILFRSSTFSLHIVNSVALFLACLLLVRALTRAGIFKVDVYPSERFLQYSITGLLTGAYLLVVGLFARLVTALGGEEAFALKAFLILVALVGLAVLLVSERLRQYLQEFISRNFTRPQYDYRTLWLTLTERTATIMHPDQLSATVSQWVSETLHILSVTIWLVDEQDGQLRLAASTSFNEPAAPRVVPEKLQTLLQNLEQKAQPFILDDVSGEWAETLKVFYSDHFKHGGSRVCVPLLAGGKLLGMVTLGDRVNAAPYGTEETDLLKCIGEQFASNVLNLQLSSKLVQARELEAFQTISAFFVHDLKNTASTLNLMLQNFRIHYDNPEFREDAFRGIAKTTSHIQELIRRLSLFRQKLEINPKPVDVNQVVRNAMECLKGKPGVRLVEEFAELPPIKADEEQLHKVFTNLLLNASEALGGSGEVRLQTCQQNGWAIISISDNGCGMSPDYMRLSLFRPFKSTKKGGLGIGMFHTKMIVEAHQGKIEVQSEKDVGTSFRVLLPTH